MDSVYSAADDKLLIGVDLSAAFNTVSHEILPDRLQSEFGVSGTSLCWIQSYFEGHTHHILLYNNVGLISRDTEDIATESTEDCRTTDCRLTPQRIPANICINFIVPETRVIGLHFAADNMIQSLFKLFRSGLRKTCLFKQTA